MNCDLYHRNFPQRDKTNRHFPPGSLKLKAEFPATMRNLYTNFTFQAKLFTCSAKLGNHISCSLMYGKLTLQNLTCCPHACTHKGHNADPLPLHQQEKVIYSNFCSKAEFSSETDLWAVTCQLVSNDAMQPSPVTKCKNELTYYFSGCFMQIRFLTSMINANKGEGKLS